MPEFWGVFNIFEKEINGAGGMILDSRVFINWQSTIQ